MGKADAQRDVQRRRERNYRQARPERDIEFKAKMNDENGPYLTEHGQPAEPHQGIEPHIARLLMSTRQPEHRANVATDPANPNRAENQRRNRRGNRRKARRAF